MPLQAGKWVAIIAALGALITAWATRRKTEADAAGRTAEIALSLVEPLETRLKNVEQESATLRDRIKCLEAENIALKTKMLVLEADNRHMKDGIAILVDQIKRLGHNPAWDGVT